MEMKKINAAKLDQQFGVKPQSAVTGINFPTHDDKDEDNRDDKDKIKS